VTVLTTRFKVLLVAAAAVGLFVLLSGPDSSAVQTVEAAKPAPSAAVRTSAAKTGRNVSSAGSADSAGAYQRLVNRVSDAKAAPALFSTQSWFVAPPPPPPPPPPVEVAPPPPTAPPLPFAVMGSYRVPGEEPVYFLTRGERVFDVRVGDTIDHIYSVDGAEGGQLLLTFMPLNVRQTLTIGETP